VLADECQLVEGWIQNGSDPRRIGSKKDSIQNWFDPKQIGSKFDWIQIQLDPKLMDCFNPKHLKAALKSLD